MAPGVDGQKHDVGTRASADPNAQFDTPTLRFVGGTAPYFHDGRYRTLRDLLVGHDGKMGATKQLSPSDMGEPRSVHEDVVRPAAPHAVLAGIAVVAVLACSGTAQAAPSLADLPLVDLPGIPKDPPKSVP